MAGYFPGLMAQKTGLTDPVFYAKSTVNGCRIFCRGGPDRIAIPERFPRLDNVLILSSPGSRGGIASRIGGAGSFLESSCGGFRYRCIIHPHSVSVFPAACFGPAFRWQKARNEPAAVHPCSLIQCSKMSRRMR